MRKIVIFFVVIIFTSLYSMHARAEEGYFFTSGEKIYNRYCSPCHGIKGDGKGFNAKNLDPRPANHTNIELMNRRTDKELYDAISRGGRFVGKSTLMPPWGETLNKPQIESLVLYLRKLCTCRGL
ncbi:MAG TPA: cytochrome c [Nitrospirae bacterium]|nr:cytochrome c [bacterium BMS3Abin06]HDH12308.1 cytochrome c [Nitrospirota bacterium]HDZ00815.1 cytochrome c [Nitrospirota bacterium]